MNYEYTVLSENNYGVSNKIRDWCNLRQSPLRQSRQRETRMTRKHRLIISFSLLGNLFDGSNGFYVSSKPLGWVLSKKLEHCLWRVCFRIRIEGVVISLSVREFDIDWRVTEFHEL